MTDDPDLTVMHAQSRQFSSTAGFVITFIHLGGSSLASPYFSRRDALEP